MKGYTSRQEPHYKYPYSDGMRRDEDNIDTGMGCMDTATTTSTATTAATTAEDIAQTAVRSIIVHYSQDIHLPNDMTSNSIADGDNNIPYFDTLLGRPNQGSTPIIEHWLHALLSGNGNDNDSSSSINNTNNNDSKNIRTAPHIQTKTDLIESYYLLIRPACFRFSRKKISTSNDLTSISRIHVKDTAPLILIHYEMMIQCFIGLTPESTLQSTTKSRSTSQRSKSVTASSMGPSSLNEGVKNGDGIVDEGTEILRSCIDIIHEVIQGLFHDIQSLTCINRIQFVGNKDDDEKKISNSTTGCRRTRVQTIQNFVLPTLLRIMQHAVHILNDILHLFSSSSSSPPRPLSPSLNSTNAIPAIEKIQSSLLIGAIAALSFCSDFNEYIATGNEKRNTPITTTSELNILEILPERWKEKFTLRHLLETCAYSPNHLSSSTFNNNVIDSNIISDGTNSSNVNGKKGGITNEYFWNLLKHSGLEKEQNEPTTACFNEPMINFDNSPSSTLKMAWFDNIQGVGFRSGRALLQNLYILSTSLRQHLSNEQEEEQSIDESCVTDTTMLDSIVKAIGVGEVMNLVRANFFGRLNHPSKYESTFICDKEQYVDDEFIEKMEGHTNTLAFNAITWSTAKTKDRENETHDISAIRRLAKLKPSLGKYDQSPQKPLCVEEYDSITSSKEDEPFNQIKARIVSSIRILSSLKFPSVSTKVWLDSLPIIYTLIDSCNSSHQSLGGALFLHLLGECTPTSFVSVGGCSEQSKTTNGIDFPTYFEGAIQLVSSAIRTSDDAVVISILSEVRSKLFEIARTSAFKPQVSSLRRIAATELMTGVKQRSYCGPNGEENVVSTITASLISVHCLLVQLSKERNAAAMEIGRLGLCTFLPLIRWDAASLVGRRIQFTAISCTISLMMGAYPIMEKHGGKVMNELLSCIDRGIRDVEIQDKVTLRIHAGTQENLDPIENSALKILIAFAAHTASVCNILCGVRASDTLDRIKSGDYFQDLEGWREIIKRESLKMLENEKMCHTPV